MGSPPSSVDVAAAIIESAHNVDQMKLHKLLYYAQAWHAAWYGEPMFRGKIEAWRWGPYVPSVGRVYGGEGGFERRVIEEPARGDPGALDKRRRAVLDAVTEAYGDLSGTELATLTKTERPWHEARGELPLGAASREEITVDSLTRYYRQEGDFGPRLPDVEVDPDLLDRGRQGDTDAVLEALEEAAKG